MTDHALFEKIVEKAVKGGWVLPKRWEDDTRGFAFSQVLRADLYIFKRDFAEAYFGDEWKDCLKEMVIESNRLEYLKGCLK
jgi:hypothetical protein